MFMWPDHWRPTGIVNSRKRKRRIIKKRKRKRKRMDFSRFRNAMNWRKYKAMRVNWRIS